MHHKKESLKLEQTGIWQRPYNLGELSLLGLGETDFHYTLIFDQSTKELVYKDSRGEQRKKLADGQEFISLENIAALVTEWGIVNNAVNTYMLTEDIASLLLAWHYLDHYYIDDQYHPAAKWFDKQMTIYDGNHAVTYALQALVNERLDGEVSSPGYKGDGEWYPGGVIDLYFIYWDCERFDDPHKEAAKKHVKENW